MDATSFESPDTGANGFCLAMSLKHFKGIFSPIKEPSFQYCYVVRVPFLTGIAVCRPITKTLEAKAIYSTLMGLEATWVLKLKP